MTRAVESEENRRRSCGPWIRSHQFPVTPVLILTTQHPFSRLDCRLETSALRESIMSLSYPAQSQRSLSDSVLCIEITMAKSLMCKLMLTLHWDPTAGNTLDLTQTKVTDTQRQELHFFTAWLHQPEVGGLVSWSMGSTQQSVCETVPPICSRHLPMFLFSFSGELCRKRICNHTEG